MSLSAGGVAQIENHQPRKMTGKEFNTPFSHDFFRLISEIFSLSKLGVVH